MVTLLIRCLVLRKKGDLFMIYIYICIVKAKSTFIANDSFMTFVVKIFIHPGYLQRRKNKHVI